MKEILEKKSVKKGDNVSKQGLQKSYNIKAKENYSNK